MLFSCDKEAFAIGHPVKSFHADNNVFMSTEFKTDLTAHDQTICFSGVGAAHQNGIAEHNMKTTLYLARALLIHSALCWPAKNNISFWPSALQHVVYVLNHTAGKVAGPPLKSGLVFGVTTTTIFGNFMFGDAPLMFLTPPYTMARRFQKSIFVPIKENSWVILLNTPPMLG
eukprot:4010416-Ditylum_brightwellii.AAC.1